MPRQPYAAIIDNGPGPLATEEAQQLEAWLATETATKPTNQDLRADVERAIRRGVIDESLVGVAIAAEDAHERGTPAEGAFAAPQAERMGPDRRRVRTGLDGGTRYGLYRFGILVGQIMTVIFGLLTFLGAMLTMRSFNTMGSDIPFVSVAISLSFPLLVTVVAFSLLGVAKAVLDMADRSHQQVELLRRAAKRR